MSEPNKQRMIPLHIADQAVAACNKEIAELRAQVARLRKAGDAMEEDLHIQVWPWNRKYFPSIKDWNAAKKGKPSV